MMRLIVTAILVVFAAFAQAENPPIRPPYPPSPVISAIHWDWKTLQTAAPGSDLWPVTWTKDDTLFTAFGDGGGFNGTDRDGRVAAGFARIDGTPDHFIGVNINGGKNPKHPASYPKKGKVGGLLAVGDRIYGWLNTQNISWPDVDEALIWSDDHGATWQRSDWVFPGGKGNLKPSTFLNAGRGYTGLTDNLGSYVYFYGPKQEEPNAIYLGRAPQDKVSDRSTYEFFVGQSNDKPQWSPEVTKAQLVFVDSKPNHDLATVVYVPGLKRYLLTNFHSGPGQLGVFDAPQPWGPWTTVAYYEDWGRMNSDGEGLNCSFPAKWMSEDGLTLWCIFSAYGGSAKQGINAHDKLNVVKVTLEPTPTEPRTK